jgi:hypothetical protein
MKGLDAAFCNPGVVRLLLCLMPSVAPADLLAVQRARNQGQP